MIPDFEGHANKFFLPMIEKVMAEGISASPRGRATKELLHQVTVLPDPRKRVLTIGNRRANPFFQLAECVWILAGASDAAWITYFNSQLRAFLDQSPEVTGDYFHAAYGERMRLYGECKKLGVRLNDLGFVSLGRRDQLQSVLSEIRRDPETRRAVMVYGNPLFDHPDIETKDRPCLAGETILWSPEGDLSIGEVARKFANGEVSRWPVYAVHPETKKLRVSWATNVWRTGVRPTIRLHFDDGSSLQVTSDHVLFKKIRTWSKVTGTKITIVAMPAGDLRPGDRVWATHRYADKKGYERHKDLLSENTSFSNSIETHREYWELLHGPIPDGFDVHHEDENKCNNAAQNLLALPHGGHSALKMQARADKHSISLKAAWDRGAYRDRGNHRIVAIENAGEVEVYDFHVPEFHAAVVGTGVIAHNCNIAFAFKLRDNKLHMTTFNRSNDVVLGLTFTNIAQFTTIQEVVAACLGVELGPYIHYSDSLHVYEDDAAKVQSWIQDSVWGGFDIYRYVSPTAMLKIPDAYKYPESLYRDRRSSELYDAIDCPYWRTAAFMIKAWDRLQNYAGPSDGTHAQIDALDLLDRCPAEDWKIAGMEYLFRWTQNRTKEGKLTLEGFHSFVAQLRAVLDQYPLPVFGWVTHALELK